MSYQGSETELNFRRQFAKLCDAAKNPAEQAKIGQLSKILITQVTYPESLVSLLYNYTVSFASNVNNDFKNKNNRKSFLSSSEAKKSNYLSNILQKSYLQIHKNHKPPKMGFPSVRFEDIGGLYGLYDNGNIVKITPRKLSFEDLMSTNVHEAGHWLVKMERAEQIQNYQYEAVPVWMKWNRNKYALDQYEFCPEEGLVRSAGALCAELISPNTQAAKEAAAIEMRDSYGQMKSAQQFTACIQGDKNLQTQSHKINELRCYNI